MCNQQLPKEIIASHEIGHFVVAAYFGYETSSIDITAKDPYIRIEFQNPLTLNFYTCSLPPPKDKDKPFAIKYCTVMISGHVCENLFKVNFDLNKYPKIPVDSDDIQILNFVSKSYSISLVEIEDISKDIILKYQSLILSFIPSLVNANWSKSQIDSYYYQVRNLRLKSS